MQTNKYLQSFEMKNNYNSQIFYTFNIGSLNLLLNE